MDSFIKNLSGHKHEEPHPPPVAHPAPTKEESIFDKIGDALGGRKTPPPPPPPTAQHENFFDKIGGALGGKKTPPPPPPAEDNDLFSKLSSTLTGKKEEPAKPQGLMDHFNHALGGGAKGEAEEGD